ncbi:FAD:protein FMN transferase [Pseudoduganella namucuonensis]|uniref:FAD:protein FMN transferase n=1 Tax=Pseudoduganella namucuonensis TaxID=1035707 RepID=A0A1I7IU39_9BURK|nr:FAD:protein FMN transferase [Pseudoduganella namucuonensis]SFU76398.1 thiamine biosynthesis lipoprotein [Pseudoduganella namucuonensis]
MRRVLLPHRLSDDPAPAGAIQELRGASMGTSWSVRLAATLDAARLEELRAGLQAQLDAVVAEMSHWDPDSHLGRFNRAPAGTWHALPPAFHDVLAYAMEVGRLSGGAYDPCAGAIVDAWGFGPLDRHDQPGFTAPDAARVRALLAQRAASNVVLDTDGRRAFQPGGARLDLSAVAKGYGVDRLAHWLAARGHRHHLVEVGGELRGAGVKPDGQPWWVGLERPIGDTLASSAPGEIVLALHGLAVATSGDYRRYFEHGGRRYSHTIDPRTAMPIANELASVTVVHPHCMAADAWSTALGVLGPRHGLALAERRGLAARFLARGEHGYTEHLSGAMRAMLEDDDDPNEEQQ